MSAFLSAMSIQKELPFKESAISTLCESAPYQIEGESGQLETKICEIFFFYINFFDLESGVVNVSPISLNNRPLFMNEDFNLMIVESKLLAKVDCIGQQLFLYAHENHMEDLQYCPYLEVKERANTFRCDINGFYEMKEDSEETEENLRYDNLQDKFNQFLLTAAIPSSTKKYCAN